MGRISNKYDLSKQGKMNTTFRVILFIWLSGGTTFSGYFYSKPTWVVKNEFEFNSPN